MKHPLDKFPKRLVSAVFAGLCHVKCTVDQQERGICGGVYVFLGANAVRIHWYEMTGILQATFPEWPEFSGELGYPVPLRKVGAHSWKELYDRFRRDGNRGVLWSEEKYNGQARRRLLDWLLTYFAEYLKENTPC